MLLILTKCADAVVDDIEEVMDIDNLTSTLSALQVNPDTMIIDEITVPCMPFDEPHCNDAMDVD
jgi:hypothetical protein